MQTIDLEANTPSELIIDTKEIDIRLPEPPERYYRHGWQSWSLAAWIDTRRPLPIPKPYLLHAMQYDPVHISRHGHHGSWVGAVQLRDGETLLLGSLGTDAHVELQGSELTGSYEAASGAWLIARSDEQAVFAKYAVELGKRLGVRREKVPPRVWCSWYSLYTAIDERTLSQVLSEWGDMPFDVFQVDDGWQSAVGDWEPNRKFPSGMDDLARKIKASGRRAGIWLAPLVAVKSSRLFRTHPDWFLHDENGGTATAGFNWGEELVALDTTHPEAIQWLRELMSQVHEWGYDYIKLDFLYAGALPGKRYEDIPREAAYREGLAVLREAMGDDTYFVACGAPIIPSIGLCDALRTGPDVAAHWESHRDAVLLHNPAIPGTRNAIRTVLHRLWLKTVVRPDPDVAYFRSKECRLTHEQKQLLQNLALVCGFRATSDLPQWLSDSERTQLRGFLETDHEIQQPGPRDFRVDGRELDYGEAMELAKEPEGWDAQKSAVLGWLANHPWALRLDHEIEKMLLRRKRTELK